MNDVHYRKVVTTGSNFVIESTKQYISSMSEWLVLQPSCSLNENVSTEKNMQKVPFLKAWSGETD